MISLYVFNENIQILSTVMFSIDKKFFLIRDCIADYKYTVREPLLIHAQR